MPQSLRATICRKTIDLFSTTSLESQESYLTAGISKHVSRSLEIFSACRILSHGSIMLRLASLASSLAVVFYFFMVEMLLLLSLLLLYTPVPLKNSAQRIRTGYPVSPPANQPLMLKAHPPVNKIVLQITSPRIY